MATRTYPYGYHPKMREAVSEYYDVDSAIRFFNSPVAPGCERWRCVLCGWGLDVTKEAMKIIGACCCGGCGQTTLRPIAEYDAK
jgi:hypothetical protein